MSRSQPPHVEALESRLPPGDMLGGFLTAPPESVTPGETVRRDDSGLSLDGVSSRLAHPPRVLVEEGSSPGAPLRDGMLPGTGRVPEGTKADDASLPAVGLDGDSSNFSPASPVDWPGHLPADDLVASMAAALSGAPAARGGLTPSTVLAGPGSSLLPQQDSLLVLPGRGHDRPLLASNLPPPWEARDVGDVGLAGNASQANNVYTVQGAGDDIFGTRDAFQFVYQPMHGDGEMLARVTGVQNTDAWAKAGVMIRESLSPHSAQAMMVLTPAQGSSFQDRVSTAGMTSFTNPVDPAANWLRIVRSGNSFTGYRSVNGHDWLVSGTVTIPMSSTAYVGLVVTSHNHTLLNTSTFDHVSPALRAPFTWNAAAPSPIPRFEANDAAVNDQLFVFGGFYDSAIDATTEADRYDPASNTWTVLRDMPQPITHAGTTVVGQDVYLAGGFVGDGLNTVTDRVLVYDIPTDTWGDAPPLPEARGAGALVNLDGQLHFFGGLDATLHDRADHWVLDLSSGTGWTSAAPLPNPRNHLGYTGLNGLAYAIGGEHGLDEAGGNQAEVDAYDPGTDTWTAMASLPLPRGHVHTATFVLNGQIVIAGGETNGPRILADVTAYNPDTDSWTALPPLPTPLQATDVQTIGGRLVVTGGQPGSGPVASTWTASLFDTWQTAAPMPISLGEVAGGVIGQTLYVVGEGGSATLAYDLSTGVWRSTGLAARPFVGNHHAAEVYGGQLYLFGGLSGNSEGKVQIYDPVLNTWTLGTPMPFAAGSSSSAVINGEVYVAGGIVNGDTTNQVAMYDPPSDTWTMRAPMPQGRNHTASATDGAQLYVFGGRVGPNAVANGFDTVEIYDPGSNAWRSSDSDSTLAPLPQARGGMGKAVYYNGEFYVLGGETLNGSGATPANVYNRVDIYDPVANWWRLGAVMPTGRHGIFPLLADGRIYVAGGGVQSGGSSSTTLEVYTPGYP
jgi:N-acetylneuraminic acid mutarotase